ncbi:MAG: 6,7-dimethyl-8-ribityllumazine synthase, partial [Actinomycetota bacterium]
MTQPDAAGSIQAPAGARRIEPVALDAGTRVAIVAAEYHTDIVQELVNGAVRELVERGVAADAIDVVPVPG